MFTGIITHLGIVEDLKSNAEQDLLLKISTTANKIDRKLEDGCSIACNGICLTLINKETSNQNIILSFQASKETCNKTTLKNWQKGDLINLEFALRVGDELGGHMVLGHVDCVSKIDSTTKIQDSHKFTFEAKKDLIKFIVEKGSITLNGTSLTINEVEENKFSVNIIPHTLENTNFKNCKVGDLVNLEIDTIARYLSKLKND